MSYVLNLLSWLPTTPASLLLLLLLLPLYNLYRKQAWLGLPPGPPCLPVVGSLPFIGLDVREPLLKLAERYGPVFTVYMGMRRVIVLSGLEVMLETFSRQEFSGRPDIFFMEHILRKDGLIASEGERYKVIKRFSQEMMRDFGIGRSVMETKVAEEVKAFLHQIDKKVEDGRTYCELDVTMLLQQTTANIVGNLTYGRRFEYDSSTLLRYMKPALDAIHVAPHNGPLTVCPALRHLPGDFFGAKQIIKDHDDRGLEWMRVAEEHKRHLAADPSRSQEPPSDFLEACVRKMNDEKNNLKTYFTDSSIYSLTSDLFIAGMDTAATTIMWGLIHFTLTPQVQQKAQNEIDEVLGGATPVFEDRERLPYFDACIQEVHRIANTAPLSLPHKTLQDCRLRGYFIPKGTMVLPNMYSVHHDPKIWDNPQIFDPTRFLDNDENREKILPFGSGKRICPGISLAQVELFLFLASILQRFDILPPCTGPAPRPEGRLHLVTAPWPCNFRFLRRAVKPK